MIKFITLELIFFGSLCLILFSLGLLIFSSIKSKKQDSPGVIIGGNLLTVASIFASISLISITYLAAQEQMQESKILLEREMELRERVQWSAKVVHVPDSRDLDIFIYCKKTSETIEPKSIKVTIEIEFLDNNRITSPKPPRKVFYNVELYKISDRSLKWDCENIQDLWSEFRNEDGKTKNISVLERPLSINILITYNFDIYAAAKVQLLPEEHSKEYRKRGISKDVIFEHIKPSRGGI